MFRSLLLGPAIGVMLQSLSGVMLEPLSGKTVGREYILQSILAFSTCYSKILICRVKPFNKKLCRRLSIQLTSFSTE